MFSSKQLQKLRCPRTGSQLVPATQELVDGLNRAIQQQRLRDGLGRLVQMHLESALTNLDRMDCYPIVNGTVQLLRDESIPLNQLVRVKHE